MPQTHAALELPAIPSLDRSHLRLEPCRAPSFSSVGALVPAAQPYLCADPNAPALLMIPGLGVDGLSFIRQLPLGALSSLYFLQTPNHGCEGERGLHAYARFAEEFILDHRLDQRPGGLVLGGASMGGAVSLAVAIRGRVKLRGLVLIGTFGSARHLPLFQRVLAPLAYVIPMGFFRKAVWLLAGRTGLRRCSREEGEWMASPLVSRSLRYYGRAVMALTRQEQIEAAGKIAVPALVLHGERDPVLPLAAGVELAETLPRATLLKITGAGHSPFFSHAPEVNAAIARFLRELPQLECGP